ncbi:MAG: hypothetical protein IIU39_03900 [Ruminococcus sp.]|nr:hypothetical protein [Ruminococcus sp.]
MRKYLKPEFEEVKYDVEDVILGSPGEDNNQEDGSQIPIGDGIFNNP